MEYYPGCLARFPLVGDVIDNTETDNNPVNSILLSTKSYVDHVNQFNRTRGLESLTEIKRRSFY